MRDRASGSLVGIEDAINAIEAVVAGFDEPSFLADAKTRAAAAMQLVVIGEGARALDDAVRAEAPEIPWTLIVTLRNRIAQVTRRSTSLSFGISFGVTYRG